MTTSKEIPYSGDFEDSDLEEESDDPSFSSESEEEIPKKQTKKKINQPKKLHMNVSDTQYPVVKFVGKMLYKFKLQYTPYLESNNWDFCWTDNAVQPETLSKMQLHQKINHFPGMYSLARKNHLGRNLNKMQKQFQDDYDFYPRTWLLPSEYGDFKNQFQKGKAKTFIVKPEASCQGKGIFLTRSIDSINPLEHYVAQRYLHKPLLIDGLKFDFRLYVLLAGCDPLRIYLYKDGLARFATVPYSPPHSQNLEDMQMHLTNYAINKDSPNFVFNQDEKQMDVGHKRSLISVYNLMCTLGYDVDKLQAEIRDLIIKTFCSVQPILQQNYTQVENFHNNMCFEILGFDILIESNGKPYLLEVNHTPSFTTDTPLDANIKKNLIRDTIKLMNINLKTKTEVQQFKKDQMQKRVLTGKKTKLSYEEKKLFRQQAQQERDEYEAQNMGDFEKIYPTEKDYEEYLAYSIKLYEEWTGANIRRNPKKQEIEKVIPKNTSDPTKGLPPPNIKTTLYKHVQSRVNTNLHPKSELQPKGNEVMQEGAESAPFCRENDQMLIGEDNQQQKIMESSLINSQSKQQFQEIQLIDLINYKRISLQQYCPETIQYQNTIDKVLQQQNSLTCLSPVLNCGKGPQQLHMKKNFSIRKPTKPKQVDRKTINYDSDQEIERVPKIEKKKESLPTNVNINNNVQNGSFIKPKIFSLKIHHPPKGYKLQSLPILMQQNYTKFRYEP